MVRQSEQHAKKMKFSKWKKAKLSTSEKLITRMWCVLTLLLGRENAKGYKAFSFSVLTQKTRRKENI